MIAPLAQASQMVRTFPDYLVIALLLVALTLALLVAARVARAAREKCTRDSAAFWIFCAGAFFAFALVKSLNMLAFVGSWLRELTRAQGAYDGRRSVQLMAMGAIGLLLVLVVAALVTSPGLARRHWPMILGISLLAAFGATRFVSYHDFDAAMRAVPWFKSIAEVAVVTGCITYCMFYLRKGRNLHGSRAMGHSASA